MMSNINAEEPRMERFSVPQVLRQSLRTGQKLAGLLIILALLPAGPVLMVSLGPQDLSAPGNFLPGGTESPGMFGPYLFLLLLLVSGLTVVSLAGYTYAALQSLQGRSIGVVDSVQAVATRLTTLFVTMLTAYFAIFLGFFTYIIPGLILTVLFFFTVPVAVSEKLQPLQVLDRSRRMSEGYRLSLLLLFAIVVLPCVLLGQGISGIMPDLARQLAPVTGMICAMIFHTVVAVAYVMVKQDKERRFGGARPMPVKVETETADVLMPDRTGPAPTESDSGNRDPL